MAATGFADLDDLLVEFVGRVRETLRDDVVGIYLQGSFALGAGDRWSDVDFIVALCRPLTDVDAVNAMHRELYARPTEWAKHLEGSYLPAAVLRTVDAERTPVPFLDNGATKLVLDAHCNSAVVRWILRHGGITLYGPPATSLVDPVGDADLKREAADALREYVEWGTGLTSMSRWAQPYLVLTICRILRTLECGDVTSKAAAGAWAVSRLPEWSALIETALADRPDPWTRVQETADERLTTDTRRFLLAVRQA